MVGQLQSTNVNNLYMIARFQNPHLLAHSITHTTRAELYGVNENNAGDLNSTGYTAQQRRLDSLLGDNLGEFPAFQVCKVRKRKRGQENVLQDIPRKCEPFYLLQR
jgi:hypothetical protein